MAESIEISTAELLVLNSDICFSPLYYLSISKFEECKAFYMGILQSQSFKTTFQQLLEGDLPAVLLEVLIRADPENTKQVSKVPSRFTFIRLLILVMCDLARLHHSTDFQRS